MSSPPPDVSPAVPSIKWRALLALLARLPQPVLSRALGRIADLRIPRRMRIPILGSFARAAGIDLTEAERPLAEYVSINALFVRRLRPGLRHWPDHPDHAGSPVDGVVGTFGPVRNGTAIQAKGRPYQVAELLDDPAAADRYHHGAFLTLYLSPRHYHRVHAPCDATIAQARWIPGALLPVNAPAIAHIDALFPRNERVIAYLDSRLGRIAVVAIGAYNVGRISVAFDTDWNGPRGHVANRPDPPPGTRSYLPPRPIDRADELMAFHLGSTVVLLFEHARAVLADTLRTGDELRLGQLIATATNAISPM